MRTTRKSLFLVLYVAFVFALLEGTARLGFMIPAVSGRLQGDDDATWRRRWVARHDDGVEIYYAFDVFDPTKGWMSRPNIRDMRVFDNRVLNTNSKGFRGRTEYPYDKNPDTTRILIIGDSFTFGDEVSDDETYSHYLQKLMPAAEVINMGVHGYGHDQMLILTKEEGLKYKPDIVMMGFLPMDMSRNLLQFRDYAKPRFVLDNENLTMTGSPVPRPEEVLKWDWARPRLHDVWSLIRYRWQLKSGRYEEDMTEITSRILDDMAATIKTAGAVPVFVYLPDGDDINDQSTTTRGERFLFSYCQERHEAHCLSVRPRFVDKMNQGTRFKTNGHWDPFGHLTAAEAIHEYLVARNLASLRSPVAANPPKND